MTPDLMNGPARYLDINLHYFTIHISAANLTVIILMVVVFVLALVLPFPSGREAQR